MSRRLRIRIAAALVASTLIGTGAVAAESLLLPPAGGDGVLTLLLLGSDEGPPRSSNPLAARADGFQLLFVAEDRQHASFVSIPRDSWVTVADRGNSRVNACLNDGPEACVTTVEQEFGVGVDGYLLTSMRGFAYAVQSFGGLTVDVPTPVFDGGADVTTTGVQELSGSQALTYARDRKNRPGGDFGRTQAQAELLAIGHADVVEAGDAAAVLDAVAVLRRHTETDLSGPELVRLAFEAMHLPPENVERALAPAQIGTVGAASVVFLEDEAYALIREAADDGRIDADGSD
jgi:polyisoprenyl-teichoic acid--peptidoglycan teichoic acid transferase